MNIGKRLRYAAVMLPALDIASLREWENLIGPRKLRAFENLANLMNGFDDKIEYMDTAVIAAQPDWTEEGLHPFVAAMMKEGDKKVIQDIADSGLMSEREMYAGFNLALRTLVSENKAILKAKTGDLNAQVEATEWHLVSTQVFLGVLAHAVKKSVKIAASAPNMKVKDFVSEYPKTAQIANIFQRLDDLKDWQDDFSLRHSKPMCWSNATVTVLRQTGITDDQLRSFNAHGNRHGLYPDDQRILTELGNIRKDICKDINKLPKDRILYGFLQNLMVPNNQAQL